MRRVTPSRAFVGLAASFFAISLSFVPSAFGASPDRIHANFANGARAEVANTVQPRARNAADLGPAAGDKKLSMSLRFAMSDAQAAALQQLLADQQNPASPRYHQWLTPAQFGAQFGLSQNDVATVTAWLKGQGFTVTGVANGGTFVSFEGTVAQANAAFGTSIHDLNVNGEQHYANVTNITLPSGLAGVVQGVTGLHNFKVHPHMGAVAHPLFTSSASGNHYVAPGDFYTIYDMQPLLSGGYTGAGIGTGGNCHSVGGATCGDIAVTGEVDLNNADVTAFRSAAGLNASNLPVTVHPVLNSVVEDPGPATCSSNCSPNAGDLQESSIDVEWSGGMAPGANILFVSSACGVLPGGICAEDAMTWIVDNNLAPIVTTSYGNCEAGWGSTDLNATNTLFEQAAAQGQTIVTSAGDSGATDCDAGTSAIEGLTADFPASSPYVVAMGGSMFHGDAEATGSGSTWSATQYWAGTSGSDVISSALSYIPEAAWNEDAAGEIFGAGGGGVSAFFAKPAWQVEQGAAGMTTTVPPDASRDVPDLALDAASGHDSLLFCYTFTNTFTSDPSYNPGCLAGFRQSAGNGTLTVAGGTSYDSQAFGGMLADILQKVGPSLPSNPNGPRLGLVNPTLYALGNNVTYYNPTASSVFHDITTGNNSNPCTAGTPNCPNGGNIGYSAATGYDLATGWGSVDLNNLASAWSWGASNPAGAGSTVGTNVSATSLTTTPACSIGSNGAGYSPCTLSVATGNSVTLTATVNGSAGTPTGSVQFLANNVALGSPVGLVNGVATHTYNASCTSLGQQQMTAVYLGSSTYAGSKGPALAASEFDANTGQSLSSNDSINTNPLIVTVTTGTCPDFSVTPSGSNTSTATISVSGANATVSVNSDGTIPPVTITVAPVNGFTGTVSFTSSVVSNTSYTPTVTFNPTSVNINSSASQTTTVNLSGITASLHEPVMPGRQSPAGHPWYVAGSGTALAGLLMIFLPRRRRLGGLLMAVLAVALAAGMTGCGGSSQQVVGGGGGNTNPYVGVYTVTVTATYTNGGQTDAHSSVLTYVIN